MTQVTALPFIQNFIEVCEEGYRRGWHERNGGNLSYRMTSQEVRQVSDALSFAGEWQPIGTEVPRLAGEYFLVTGSGKYMRNVKKNPEENICIAQLDEKGENFRVVWGLIAGGRPTSEFPTHLMNHEIKKLLTADRFRVIYHAHPTNVIALTFVLPLNDKAFTHEIWEMATENPVIIPGGIGVVPWMVPGGRDIAIATSALMKKYDIAIWAHHGVFCAGADFDETFALMETLEKGAEICVKVHAMGGKRQTIPEPGFVDLARDFKIDLNKSMLNL